MVKILENGSLSGLCFLNHLIYSGSIESKWNPRSIAFSMTNSHKNPTLAAALELSDLGFRVFPVHGVFQGKCTCGGKPRCTIGKHPRIKNYSSRATSNQDQLIKWFNKDFLNSNIGVPTGERSHIWVLDVDPKSGGFDSLKSIQKQHGNLPDTVSVETGGGGLHFYFRYHRNQKISCSAGKLAPGLDVRGIGGYVLGPGSVHESGKHYKWIKSPRGVQIADAPQWLLDLISRLSKKRVPIDTVSGLEFDQSFASIQQGTRNHVLFSKVACFLRDKYIAKEKVLTICLALNGYSCSSPLPVDEVRNAVNSAFNYPKRPSRIRTLSESAQKILELFEYWSKYEPDGAIECSLKKISEEIGISVAGVRKCIKQLEKFKLIQVHEQVGKVSKYVLP